MTAAFGARLAEALAARGPLCVGIDPHPGLLEQWGLQRDVDGLRRFTDTCVSAFAGTVALVKPQSAFYEAYASPGIAVLEGALAMCRAGDTLVCLDVKRGDIGSTMTAYAQAYLDPSSPLHADAITASPYLGVTALEPAFERAARHGGGVFVLALTSNPEGAAVQRASTQDGRSVAQAVLDELAIRNEGAHPLGSFGAVIGATVAELDVDLSRLNGPVLAPGLGAQGATPAQVRALFADLAGSVVPSTSRDVLRHGPDVTRLRDAARRQIDELDALRR